jgi:hypothetical protein
MTSVSAQEPTRLACLDVRFACVCFRCALTLRVRICIRTRWYFQEPLIPHPQFQGVGRVVITLRYSCCPIPSNQPIPLRTSLVVLLSTQHVQINAVHLVTSAASISQQQ